MSTAQTTVDQTRSMLLAGTREQVNTLATALTDTTGTTVVTTYDLKGIQEGAVIEIDAELLYVVATSPSAKTATVLRGYGESTAATHTSGTIITVNPKFARVAILNAQNDTLDDLSGEGLFQVITKELTYNNAVQGYNLTGLTDADEIYSVSYQDVGPRKAWPLIPSSMWEYRPNAETDDFASGFAVIVTGQAQSGRQLRVTLKTPFTRLTALSQDWTTTGGLPSTATDLLKYSSAMKLVYWRETMRNVFESQGDSRRAEEVPMGAQITAARGWQVIYTTRLRNELNRMARRYPEPRYG